jgi:cell division protein ZapA
LRGRYEALAGSVDRSEGSMRSRAGTLAGMLDEVLEDRRAG